MTQPHRIAVALFVAWAAWSIAPGCAPGTGALQVTGAGGTGDDDAADDDAADDDAADDDVADDDAADDDAADDDVADDDAADDDTADDDTGPDTSEYDGAVIEILSPESGSLVPLGEPMPLEAVVVGVGGNELPFDDVAWSTDQDASFSYVGASGLVEGFPVGTHTITARAELPNGDRVAYAVGGVLVQHERAGVYSGTFGLSLSAEINGTPLYTSCLGSASFVVDAWGETVDGDAGCTIDLFGLFSQDIAFGIGGEMDPDSGHVEGELGLVIWYWELPTPYTADFDESGTFVGSFSQDLLGVTVEGSLEGTRVALTPG